MVVSCETFPFRSKCASSVLIYLMHMQDNNRSGYCKVYQGIYAHAVTVSHLLMLTCLYDPSWKLDVSLSSALKFRDRSPYSSGLDRYSGASSLIGLLASLSASTPFGTSSTFSASHFSASSAAMQPVPADVTACR